MGSMSADPLTVDTRDYWDLATEDKTRLRQWLCPLMGVDDIDWVVAIRLGEGYVDVARIMRDENDCPIRNGDDLATFEERFPAPSPPPVWKPLR
jgi:hypothetical protein